jgi:7-carboxy-7-deazaguanine synthase
VLSESLAAGAIRVSELFHSLQGEGPSTGVPAHFLRLQGCDVGCHWCDTRYTWAADGGSATTVDAAFADLGALGAADLLVVTGGEPLAHPGIAALLGAALERWPRVEVETSGILPPPASHPRLYYNHSPKLPSATDRWAGTWAHARAFTADPNTTFKLVIGDAPDEADALRLLAEHELPRNRTVLMPEGLTDAALRVRAIALAETCRRQNIRLSPRLHVWLWGARRGV